MNIDKKLELINKIIAGGFFTEISGSLYYIDLVIDEKDKVYLDYVYNKTCKEAVAEGTYTEIDYLKLCKERGDWDEEEFNEIPELHKQIEAAKKKYYYNFYSETQKKVLKKKIADINDKIRKILIKKIIIVNEITAEYFAEKHKKGCRYDRIVKDIKGCNFNSYEFIDEDFKNSLEIAISDNSCTEAEIREIARTNPWRTSWEVGKSSFSDMFGIKIGGSTQEQFSLCYWSQFYDGIFAGYERPDNDILEDDIALDVWYELKINEQEAGEDPAVSNKVAQHQEVFVKTDKENSDKIYDKNNKMVRNAMGKRDKIIKENGGMSEAELLKRVGRVEGELFVQGK